MKEKERFLVVEKTVKVVNDSIEDFVLDIPLSQEVRSISGVLISATSNKLKYDLKHDTKCPYFSSDFGYYDFISKINPIHPRYNEDFADLFVGSPVVDKKFLVTLYLRYAKVKCLTKEYEKIILTLNSEKLLTVGEEGDLQQMTITDFYGNFRSNIFFLGLRAYPPAIDGGVEHDNIKSYLSFATFFDINFLSKILDLSSRIPFVFDYARYFAGTMSIALNGEQLILRNTRLTLNQANKTLQNNLINVGDINNNNGFLRCTYFSKNHNLFENIGYRRPILKGGVIFPYYYLKVANFTMKVKVYVKYIKNE